jgi:hypothetical protein
MRKIRWNVRTRLMARYRLLCAKVTIAVSFAKNPERESR